MGLQIFIIMFLYYKFKSYTSLSHFHIVYRYDIDNDTSLRIGVDFNTGDFESHECNFNPIVCPSFYEEITEEEFNCYLEL